VWKHVLRPRTLLYFTLWSGIGVALVVALFIRSAIDLNVTPVRNPTFVTMSDGSIRNTYELRLRSKEHEPATYRISVGGDGTQDLVLAIEGAQDDNVVVPADQTLERRVYLTAPPQ